MSSGLRLALLTLNLTQNDFVRMNRDNLKKYIENFFKQEYVRKDFEKYKIAATLLLDNKPRIEEENIYDDVQEEHVNDDVQEENSIEKKHYTRNNSLVNPFFHNSFFNPFSMFNTNFSNMMNEIDNLHRNFDNFNMEDNSSRSCMRNSSNTNTMNGYNGNGFTKSYSRTYVNNNGTGYIKEESMENDGKGSPKVKSFYRKIENGKYVEEPKRTSQKLIEQ